MGGRGNTIKYSAKSGVFFMHILPPLLPHPKACGKRKVGIEFICGKGRTCPSLTIIITKLCLIFY